MYCKHCGKQIDENSEFCKHCGKSQNNSNKEFKNKSIWIIIIYIIWALSNFYLLMGEKDIKASSYFFPFTKINSDYWGENWNKNYYDYSEFIVYVFILPVILYFILPVISNYLYRFYNKEIKEEIKKMKK